MFPRIKSALLPILITLFVVSASYAQTKTSEQETSEKQLITLKVSGEIDSKSKIFGNLPTDLIDQFVAYSSLENITLVKDSSTYRITAKSHFTVSKNLNHGTVPRM